MRSTHIYVLAIAVVFSVSPVFAQSNSDNGGQPENTINVNLDFGEISFDRGADTNLFLFSGGYGFFITDQINLGPRVSYYNLEAGPAEFDTFDAAAFGSYYFKAFTSEKKGEFYPYAGAQFGVSRVSTSSDSESGMTFGVHAGGDYMLTNALALRGELQFNRRDLFGDQDFSLFTAGLTYFH